MNKLKVTLGNMRRILQNSLTHPQRIAPLVFTDSASNLLIVRNAPKSPHTRHFVVELIHLARFI